MFWFDVVTNSFYIVTNSIVCSVEYSSYCVLIWCSNELILYSNELIVCSVEYSSYCKLSTEYCIESKKKKPYSNKHILYNHELTICSNLNSEPHAADGRLRVFVLYGNLNTEYLFCIVTFKNNNWIFSFYSNLSTEYWKWALCSL